MKYPELCNNPNIHAPATSYKFDGNSIRLEGYQCFNINNSGIFNVGVDHVKKKYQMLYPLFENFKGKSFLDLGCNNGLFSFMAYNKGMFPITMLDIDEKNINLVNVVVEYLKLVGIGIQTQNVDKCNLRADVVNALSLIHWIYSCTAVMGSLDKIIEHLSYLSKELLIIEWVEPDDGAIQFFKHLGYNKDFIKEPYNRTNFLKALETHFVSFKSLGKVRETRELYLCNKLS